MFNDGSWLTGHTAHVRTNTGPDASSYKFSKQHKMDEYQPILSTHYAIIEVFSKTSNNSELFHIFHI